MKKYNILLFFVLALGLYSCDQDNVGTLYSDGESLKVAFASKALTHEMIVEDDNKILVPVYRSNTKGAKDVELKFTPGTAANGVFSLQSNTVSFEDGKSVAYAQLSYNNINSLSPTTVYTMDLSIKDSALLSPSMLAKTSVKALRKLTYQNIGEGNFTSTFFEDSWKQIVYKAEEGNIYKLTDCYMSNYSIIFSVNADNTVSFEKQETGYKHSTYGMVSFDPKQSNGTITTGSVANGKTITLRGRFTVTAGSFGTYAETIVLP